MMRTRFALALYLGFSTPALAVSAGCLVGTGQTVCLAAGSWNHVMIENNSTGNIACNWGGTPVLADISSVQLLPNGSALWGPMTGGVPGTALNCIAANASSPLYLEH